MSRRPAVYSIAAGTPFVDALAGGLLARHGGDPLAFSRVRVLVPTRRSVRALREAFLRLGGGAPLLLPAVRPLGDIDEDELTLEGPEALDLPPPVAPLRRLLLLTRLVRHRPTSSDPAQAARLAAELTRLIDQVQAERLDFADLAGLVPGEYAEHWQQTLEFLGIVSRHWPGVLAAEGAIDPAEHRNRLLEGLAQRWRETPPAEAVYAAGITGSIPATVELLQVVAGLPGSAVVLPGLDHELDAASWAAVGRDPTHPQHGLARLLACLEVDRAEVRPWRAYGLPAASSARRRLLGEALRPAETTDAWAAAAAPDIAALDGLLRIDAPGLQEEAAAIALLLRQALETPGRTAALVTPDRELARRVAGELQRWEVAIDDSGGRPLAQTPPGSLFRLAARLISEAAAPVTLLAALKHPLAAGGTAPERFRRRVRRLERLVLRGPRPAPGFAGLVAALPAERRTLALRGWLERIAAAAAPFAALAGSRTVPLAALVRAHVQFVEWLAMSDQGQRLWSGDAGEALAGFVDELLDAVGDDEVPGNAWPGLLDALLAGRVVRPLYGQHPRLAIWGLLEARLQQADLIVLGGLNEGTWPAEAPVEPWLNRPMRARFGLPPPEWRIGLAAHDFQQLAAAREVVLTRAEKVDGTPTVPSRWLLRLETLLAGHGLALPAAPAAAVLEWGRALDRPAAVTPAAPPAPRPPAAARPRRLSVTEVETWIRDPYAIYARHVLRLRPLDPIDADPGAAERGTAIHDALDRFVRAWPGTLPEDALERLLACGRDAFGDTLSRPVTRAFWWPRFVRIAERFLAFEAERRAAGIRTLASECRGEMTIAAAGGPFVLAAKADRIDRLVSGDLAILDYKTGRPPSGAQVESGLAPQLPLEAAIAGAAGFAGLPPARVAEIGFLHLSGRGDDDGWRPLDGDPATLAAVALDGLTRRITAFDLVQTPYLSRPRPQFIRHAGDYDHLARVKEWAAALGDEG